MSPTSKPGPGTRQPHGLPARRPPLSPKPSWQRLFLEPRYDPAVQQEFDEDLQTEPARRHPGRRHDGT